MSITRLRQLSGIKESIADSSEINGEIERRLDRLPENMRTPVLDALEVLKNAGEEGILVPKWAKTLSSVLQDPTIDILDVLRTAAKLFSIVVFKVKPRHYKWQIHKAWDPQDEVDPAIKTTISGQVELINLAFRVMKAMGRFTEQELKDRLYTNKHIPRRIIDAFVNHLLEYFSGMLTKTGETYTFIKSDTNTRKKNMQLFRNLGNTKKI